MPKVKQYFEVVNIASGTAIISGVSKARAVRERRAAGASDHAIRLDTGREQSWFKPMNVVTDDGLRRHIKFD